MAIVMGGMRYAVMTSRLAVPRASAYAHVVKATEVGNTPRNTIHTKSEVAAVRTSRTSAGAYGKQHINPMTQHVQVT